MLKSIEILVRVGIIVRSRRVLFRLGKFPDSACRITAFRAIRIQLPTDGGWVYWDD